MGFSLAVRTIDQRPVVCNARPMLLEAHEALECGSIVEAGCRLREAVRLFLLAECEYFAVPLTEGQKRSPREVGRAFKKAGFIDKTTFEWYMEIVDVGNQAAHLADVEPSAIRFSLELMHETLDCAHYLVQPGLAKGRRS